MQNIAEAFVHKIRQELTSASSAHTSPTPNQNKLPDNQLHGMAHAASKHDAVGTVADAAYTQRLAGARSEAPDWPPACVLHDALPGTSRLEVGMSQVRSHACTFTVLPTSTATATSTTQSAS